MDKKNGFVFAAVGQVHSSLKERTGAPRQAWDGAPGATVEIYPDFVDAVEGINPGAQVWILTCLHQADRSVLKVRPRGCMDNPLTGVFATRSPDRPNPIGLHRATVLALDEGRWLRVEGLEAIDGTPVLDVKPVLPQNGGS